MFNMLILIGLSIGGDFWHNFSTQLEINVCRFDFDDYFCLLYYLFSKMQLKTFIFPKIAIAFLIWFTLSSHSIII